MTSLRLSYASSPESDLEQSSGLLNMSSTSLPPRLMKCSSDPSIATQDDNTVPTYNPPPPYTPALFKQVGYFLESCYRHFSATYFESDLAYSNCRPLLSWTKNCDYKMTNMGTCLPPFHQPMMMLTWLTIHLQICLLESIVPVNQFVLWLESLLKNDCLVMQRIRIFQNHLIIRMLPVTTDCQIWRH